MKPELESQTQPESAGENRKRTTLALGVAAAAALLLFSGVFGEAGSSIKQDADRVGEAERVKIESQFMAYNALFKTVDLDAPGMREAVAQAPFVAGVDAERMVAEADAGKYKIGMVSVWDNFDEDGDVVQIAAEGITATVPIMHAQQTFYLPFKKDSVIQITGLHDGTGGITAAIATESGPVPLPVMAVSQTITLPHY